MGANIWCWGAADVTGPPCCGGRFESPWSGPPKPGAGPDGAPSGTCIAGAEPP